MSDRIKMFDQEFSSSELQSASNQLHKAMQNLQKAYNNMTDYDSKLFSLYEYESGFVFSDSSSSCVYSQISRLAAIADKTNALAHYAVSVPKEMKSIDSSFWPKSFNESYQDVKSGIIGWGKSTVGFWSELFRTATGTADETNIYFAPHGIVYKTFQVGKAICGSILAIKSIVAIARAAVVTVGTGGAGAPLLVLAAIYAGNTLGSNISDYINLYYGNYDEVGKSNWLKNKLNEGYGMLLGEETGKAVGTAIYDGGSLLSAFHVKTKTWGPAKVDTQNVLERFRVAWAKVIQAPDLWDVTKKTISSSGSYVKGLFDIAIHNDIFDKEMLRYDLTLLSHQAPSISELKSTYELLKKLAKTTKKLTKYTSKSVCGVVSSII